MINVYCQPGEIIVLGRQGETGVRRLLFNLKEWMNYYPAVFNNNSARLTIEYYCGANIDTILYPGKLSEIQNYTVAFDVGEKFVQDVGKGYLRLCLVLDSLMIYSPIYETCVLDNLNYTEDELDILFQHIDAGDYATYYSIRDSFPLYIDGEGQIDMEIAAFDKDTDENGNTIPITFITKYAAVTQRFNPALEAGDEPDTWKIGTGTIGGWRESELRAFIKEQKYPLIKSKLRNRIVSTVKYSQIKDETNTKIRDDITYDYLWIPSRFEVFGNSASYESKGVSYVNGYFNTTANRIKYFTDGTTPKAWGLRSAFVGNDTHPQPDRRMYTSTSGSLSAYDPAIKSYLIYGFCIG